MSLYIALNKDIECESICRQISSLVNKYQKNNIDLSEYILCIELKKSINSTAHQLNLEHKNISV